MTCLEDKGKQSLGTTFEVIQSVKQSASAIEEAYLREKNIIFTRQKTNTGSRNGGFREETSVPQNII